MPKIDFKKQFKELFSASKTKVQVVDVPTMNFFMVDGKGDPNNSQSFQEAMESLYGMAYTLKFMLKGNESFDDFVVPPLEGLWWTDDMGRFSMDNKKEWNWTVMNMQPEFVTGEMVDESRAQLEKKKNPVALSKLRFEKLSEGKCVQIMHIGPYDTEAPTISKMHQFIALNGFHPDGKHHEIYLSDPRRTAPEKQKTILRQPIRLA